MALKAVPVLLGLLQVVIAMPAVTLQDLDVADDTMSVGSYVREVRAAPPDYHKSYENEGDGEVGYSRKKSGGGKRGYQHFDSFHKKAGDNYEFEKQDSYGQDEDDEAGAHSHRDEQRALPLTGYYQVQPRQSRQRQPPRRHPKQSPRGHLEPSSRYIQAAASERHEDETPRPKNKKQKNGSYEDESFYEGPHHEELKEGAPDGNGGKEAYGHDPNDYILPEKYTVLTEDDYYRPESESEKEESRDSREA